MATWVPMESSWLITQEELFKIRRKAWNSREFFLEQLFEDLMNIGAIQATLTDKGFHPARKVHQMSQQIQDHYSKVFAILILVDQLEAIEAFFEEQKYDTRMPFDETPLSKIAPIAEQQFLTWQYQFTAPVLASRLKTHLRFPSNTILPFVVNEPIGTGGFGTVYKVGLYSSHQRLAVGMSKSDDVFFFARKELQRTGPKAEQLLKQEIKTLETLGYVMHPNVLSLQCSYTLDGVHNLIFPLAEMDIQKWFENERSEGPEQLRHHSSVLLELRGLASGLHCLHNFTDASEGMELELIGYHHDLKPSNILIRKGHFEIADFGLSRFKNKSSGSTTPWKAGTETYGAPECRDADFQKVSVGRGADIWSFGCILAEILVYLHGGVAALEDLRKRRVSVHTVGKMRFEDDSFHQDGQLKGSVREFLEALFVPNQVPYLDGLRNLCYHILVGDPKARPGSHNIMLQLSVIGIRSLFLDLLTLLKDHRILFSTLQSSSYKLIADLIDLEMSRYCSIFQYFGVSKASDDIQADNNLIELLYPRLLKWFDDVKWRTNDMVPPVDVEGGDQNEIHECTREGMYELSSLIDELLDFLPISDRTKIEDSPDDDPYDSLQDLDAGEGVLQTDISAKLPLNTWSAARTNPMYERLTAKAVSRSISLMITQSRRSGTKSLLMERELIDVQSPSSEHQLVGQGTATGEFGLRRNILVEWKHYNSSWSGSQTDELYKRVEDLAQKLLSLGSAPDASFLKCMGYFHQPADCVFGLVLAHPNNTQGNAASSIQIASLESIIRRNIDLRRQPRPSLGKIFNLARKVAQGLVIMHYGHEPWFHKNLTSEHIIFLQSPEMDETRAPDISHPYIVGFNLSRPDIESAFSHPPPSLTTERNLYRHPVYSSEVPRYCKAYDYYSLGMVLLEIGLWTPLSALDDSLEGLDVLSAHEKVITRYVPQLAERVGDFYKGVVDFCLGSSEEDHDSASCSVYEDEKVIMAKILDILDSLNA